MSLIDFARFSLSVAIQRVESLMHSAVYVF